MPYIIAEVGPNHNGSVKMAKKMISALAGLGADAVKFQLAVPENVYSKDAFKARYQNAGDKSPSAIAMSRKVQLSFADHKLLYGECTRRGVDYISSAFDLESLKFLDRNFNMPYFKIPSGEAFSSDMLEYVAGTRRAVLLSTGMSSHADIAKAMAIINKKRRHDITLMHCVSEYPVSVKDCRLGEIPVLKKMFGCPVGFSDHTAGAEAAAAALALGARVIEKHVTMDKGMPGPDHRMSMSIDEFKSFVQVLRGIDEALGATGSGSVTRSQKAVRSCARKSIVAARNIARGEKIGSGDICFKRPGTGLSPMRTNVVVGRKARRDIQCDRVIKIGDLACP